MKMALPVRKVCLAWFTNLACAAVLTVAVGAGAVIAASESLQPRAGNAVAVLCGAVGGCQGAMDAAPVAARDAALDP